MVLDSGVLAAGTAAIMLTPILLVAAVCRGQTGVCTFAWGHASLAAPGVAGDDFFKEALLGGAGLSLPVSW